MGLILNGDKGIEYSNLNQDIKSLLLPKNWIINGMFDVWQRGTSQTSTSYGSADRWLFETSGATGSLSRQAFTVGQTDVPNNPKYYARLQITVANDNARIEQRIEDVTKFSNKQVSYSLWIKADAPRTLTMAWAQVFGDSGSTSVVGLVTHSIGTAWQQIKGTFILPSVVGKTINNNNYFALFIQNANFETFTFDIANVSLVEGSVAVECQNQPYADVLRDCQRYYQQFKSESGARYIGSSGFAWSTTNTGQLISLPVELRSIPNATLDITGTVSLVSPSGVGFTINSLGISVSESLRTQVLLSATSSGLTVGTVYFLRLSSGASIGISAEL